MSKQTVEVTEKHIQEGNPKKHDSCPVALALVDKGYKNVHVSNNCFSFIKDGLPYSSWLPRKAEIFIHHFDKHHSGEPFEFDFEPVRWGPTDFS